MKKGKFIVIGFLVLFTSIGLISAQNPFIDVFFDRMIDTFSAIFSPIFGGNTGEFLFAKILFFFLLFSLIFISLREIDIFADNRGAHVIVTIVVSILAIRFIREGELINAILLPYTALGASLSLFLPLFIFFWFLHSSGIGPFGRKFAWFIYLVMFIMLWGSRSSLIGSANWAFGIGLLFVLISLFFDKHVHSYFEIGKYNKSKRTMIEERIASLLKSAKNARDTGNYNLANRLERDADRLTRKI